MDLGLKIDTGTGLYKQWAAECSDVATPSGTRASLLLHARVEEDRRKSKAISHCPLLQKHGQTLFRGKGETKQTSSKCNFCEINMHVWQTKIITLNSFSSTSRTIALSAWGGSATTTFTGPSCATCAQMLLSSTCRCRSIGTFAVLSSFHPLSLANTAPYIVSSGHLNLADELTGNYSRSVPHLSWQCKPPIEVDFIR